MRRWACGTLVLVAVGWLLPSQALAATFTVTKTTDTADGACNADCSLREAVIAANATPSGTDTIVVPAGTYPLTLDGANENLAETGDLDLTGEHVDIVGAGVGATIVDAGEMTGLNDRVFHIGAFDSFVDPSATIRGLTITGGFIGTTGIDDTGGGIRVDSGTTLILEEAAVVDNYNAVAGAGIFANVDSTVTIRRSTIEENETTYDTSGGGVYLQDGTLDIDRSLIHDNHSSDPGGGIYVVSGEASIVNSTVSGNTTLEDGGGIVSLNADVSILNATITGNVADRDGSGDGSGGGIFQSGAATVSLKNSILAGNQDGSAAPAEAPDCLGSVTSTGNNIVGDATGCTFGAQPTDQVGSSASPVDPRLGPLADNGGPTKTHALLDGSLAIDAADQAPPVDQRGAPRNSDIGAYERVFCLDVLVNVVGTDGDDVLGGTAGSVSVLGLGGNDEIATEEGDDTVCAGDGNDRVQTEGGRDGVLAGSGKDVAAGGGGKDKLWGEGQKDTLKGQGGKDTLRGGGGKDKLVGGGGPDVLKGQAGKDTSNGGGGRDTCRAPAKEVSCER